MVKPLTRQYDLLGYYATERRGQEMRCDRWFESRKSPGAGVGLGLMRNAGYGNLMERMRADEFPLMARRPWECWHGGSRLASPECSLRGPCWSGCGRRPRRLRSRALQPIETATDFVEDRGVQFLVRVISNLRRKLPHNGRKNPFLPYEQDLYVADASPTHVCILNKYNVVDLHLLIITRAFEHQETMLRLADFQALWRCLGEYDSLGFYNSGHLSGASQPHKHLQIVPLPLAGKEARHAFPWSRSCGMRPHRVV